ncbi:hypothetical protein KSP40_PGU015009 [Platanthera guangdongensis]|uniref:Uncharacterized protein n=1 Tax=Platanthera guangdongensis TaxID=2320717 RepID=A0ABR2M8H2_9ASPA
MLPITERRKVGSICGREIYDISKIEMIAIPHSTGWRNMTFCKNENRSFVKLPCK